MGNFQSLFYKECLASTLFTNTSISTKIFCHLVSSKITFQHSETKCNPKYLDVSFPDYVAKYKNNSFQNTSRLMLKKLTLLAVTVFQRKLWKMISLKNNISRWTFSFCLGRKIKQLEHVWKKTEQNSCIRQMAPWIQIIHFF